MKKTPMILITTCLLFASVSSPVKCDAKGSDAFCSLANVYGFQISDDFTPCYMTTFKEYSYSY